MNELLLVLLLISDPSARPAADAIAQRITDQAGVQVRVVIGPDALAELKKHDVTDGDLTTQAAVGIALTNTDHKLAIVQLDRQERGGNVVFHTTVWSLGHRDQHVAIAGNPRRGAGETKPVETKPVDVKPVDAKPVEAKPADEKPAETAKPASSSNDPLDSVGRGVIGILAPWLAAAGGTPAAAIEGRLAGLADKLEWKTILSLTDDVAKPSARQRYYRVLALVRSDRPADAEKAFLEFKAAQPTHVLLTALDDLLHPTPKAAGASAGPDINNDPAPDDGSNTLR